MPPAYAWIIWTFGPRLVEGAGSGMPRSIIDSSTPERASPDMVVLVLLKLRRPVGESTKEFLRTLLTGSEQNQADTLRLEAKGIRDEVQLSLSTTRKELMGGLDGIQRAMADASLKQAQSLGDLREKVSDSVGRGLKEIQEKNEQKLDQMRQTVDEKLQKTLETRLAQSFETVTRQLLAVQKGLTEMQTLAQDVGGLKKALTNVKVRGMLGEAQLSALLEQFLTKEQYAENVAIKPRSSERSSSP